MISNLVNKLFGGETEFTKRWMARVTIVILLLILFMIPLIGGILLLHIKWGLSYRMCKMFFETYTGFCTVCVSAYFVGFIGYMGKAFMAKREEERNKLSDNIETVDDEESEE